MSPHAHVVCPAGVPALAKALPSETEGSYIPAKCALCSVRPLHRGTLGTAHGASFCVGGGSACYSLPEAEDDDLVWSGQLVVVVT